MSPTSSPGLSPLDEGEGSIRDSSPPWSAGRAAAGSTSCGRTDGTRPTSGRHCSALRHASHINKRAEGVQFVLCGAPFEASDHSDGHTAGVTRHAQLGHGQSGGSTPPVVAHTEGVGAGIKSQFMPSDGHFSSPSSGWPWTKTPRGCLPRNQHLLDKGAACR